MKAPEKLYIDSREHWMKSWTAFTTKAKGDDIEYIRSEVFIEKAKKWFKENFMNGHKWEISTYEFENIQSMVDEFKKYMEGEKV